MVDMTTTYTSRAYAALAVTAPKAVGTWTFFESVEFSGYRRPTWIQRLLWRGFGLTWRDE
jgi:hypothetical protein